MIRLLATTVAFLSGALLPAAVGLAQAPGAFYTAVPVSQPTRTELMTRSTPWSLRGNTYVANRANERDTILCELVAKNAGELASFTAGGKAFDTAALAKCNAKARKRATVTAAAD